MAECSLQVRLLGRFSISYAGREINGLEGPRARELLCFLLLNASRRHPREALAGTLWGDAPGDRSRRNLRQALWQLHHLLRDGSGRHLLTASAEWVGIDRDVACWVDAAEVQSSFAAVRDIPGHQIAMDLATGLERATELYTGDLLEECYDQWCLFERERLQNTFLLILDKLVSYTQRTGEYERGLEYASRALRYDLANERTHVQKMRLHLLAGDRTAALRQYQRCVTALREELGVAPLPATVQFYEQVRHGAGVVLPSELPALPTPPAELPVVERLKHLQTAFLTTKRQILREIRAMERELETGGH